MDTAGQAARHTAELQNITIAFADKLQGLYLPALENRLMEMADNARNNEQQWRLMQLSREIKRQRAILSTHFKKSLANGFQQFQHDQLGGKDTHDEDMSTDLSLVADEALEQELAATSLARRAETRFAETLYALNQRLAMMKGGKKIPEDGNPLGPYQFAVALQGELDPLKLDSKLNVVAFRMFEKLLLENLGDLYQGANDYLVKQGVLPNLRFGVGVSSQRPKPAAPATPPAPAAEAVPANTAPAPVAAAPQPPQAAPQPAMAPSAGAVAPGVAAHLAEQQLYSAIRQLQQAGRLPEAPVAPTAAEPVAGQYAPGFFSQPAYPVPSGAASAPVVYSPGEVMQALATVNVSAQAGALEQYAVPPPMTVEHFQSVTHQLREEMGEEKQLADDDGRIIDLVGMIFEFMLSDKQLPDAVKSVLSYLHTPYLKAAFIDRDLFEQPEHPARQLLNALAEAGARWVNSDGDSQFKVFPKIKSIVRRILTEFNNDMTLFDDLLAEMQEYNQKVDNNVSMMEKRAREKAEGEERLREVKRRVLYEVRKRMDGQELPSYMVVLLLHPWSDYLTFTLLRHGEESSLWQEGLDSVDDMIWSIAPKSSPGERNRLMLMQEPMQARVQSALETIAYDQARTAKLLDSLNKSQLLALQNLGTEPAPANTRHEMEHIASAGLQDQPYDPDTLSEAEREIVEKLKMVEFGTWLEFDELDDKRNLKAKIAWFNAQTSRYMLVDRTGKQIGMKSGVDIAKLILAGQARMIAGAAKPFFERALENVFVRLKASLAQPR